MIPSPYYPFTFSNRIQIAVLALDTDNYIILGPNKPQNIQQYSEFTKMKKLVENYSFFLGEQWYKPEGNMGYNLVETQAHF